MRTDESRLKNLQLRLSFTRDEETQFKLLEEIAKEKRKVLKKRNI